MQARRTRSLGFVAVSLVLPACGYQALPLLSGDAHGSGTGDASGSGDAGRDGNGHPANWWNASWGSRMELTISNTSSSTLTPGYQIGFSFDLDAAPCGGNRDQVRIVFNNQTDLSRVIDEDVGTNEWTWFPLQAPISAGASDSSYWLYCGNPTPSLALTDPASVFDVWDDFAGNALANSWVSTGSVSVANSTVTIGPNGAVHSTAAYDANTATDMMATATGTSVSGPSWSLGYGMSFNASAPWILWYASSANALHPSVNETGTQHNDTASALDLNPHIYGVETYGTSGAFRFADTIVDTHTYTSTVGALNVRLDVIQASGTVSLDWVRMRKAVSPAPGVSVGTVETY